MRALWRRSLNLLLLLSLLVWPLQAGAATRPAHDADIVSPPDTATPEAPSGPIEEYNAGPDADVVAATLRESPLLFIENVGQFDPAARFQVRGGGGTLWLADDALWLTLLEPTPRAEPDLALPPEDGARGPRDRELAEGPRQAVHIRLSFDGANPSPRLEPYGRSETVVSYFFGSDPEGWRPDVPVWSGVRYADLYPGIDLVVGGGAGRWTWHMEVDAEVDDPGAALAAVRLRVEGADSLSLVSGALQLETAVGGLALPLLQSLDAQGQALAADAPRVEGVVVAAPFALASAAPQAAPAQASGLVYSTFLGGSDSDLGEGIAVDGLGQAYVTGWTFSADFPAGPGYDTDRNGGWDAFAVKLNAAGTALLYATFLGGSDDDYGNGIAVDGIGQAHVTGNTYSADFPVGPGYDTGHNGYSDAFTLKLNAAGTALLYSTFLGGSDDDYGNGIAVDGIGQAHVTGYTGSVDFPTTPGAYDTTHNGGAYDAFVVKLNAAGTALIYATFLGGSSSDFGNDIAVDAMSQAYVTGHTFSADFPAGPGYDTGHNGYSDAFVVKLNAAGTALLYSTFLGGSDDDYGYGIAVDAMSQAYVTGHTFSADFPAGLGYDTGHNGYRDAFVVKLNAAGTALLYSTFLGGSDYDYGYGIAVDAMSQAYVTGHTFSADFPAGLGYDTGHNGYSDAFVVKLNTSGTALLYATFLGGSEYDYGYGGIAVDATGQAYVTGYTSSTDFPVGPGYDTGHNGWLDAFVTVLQPIDSTIHVLDEFGAPLEGAEVFHNGDLVGATSADGSLTVPSLSHDDTLVARLQVHEEPSPKAHHGQGSTQNWSYRVYLTSMEILGTGEVEPLVVDDPAVTQELTIRRDNTLIGFNIVASVEWDANASYLEDLRRGFEEASAYLYNASNGQMLFEQVTIHDDSEHMADADYHILADNSITPHVKEVGGIGASGLYVFLGRYWDGKTANNGSWDQPNGYRTVVHEFGHYGLYLYDSYVTADGKPTAHCTSADIRRNQTPEINATLMDFPYTSNQFAARGVAGLWSSSCELTRQWYMHGESDWETIWDHYQDVLFPPRWALKTPATYGAVVPGPTTIPMARWSSVALAEGAAESSVCEPPREYRVTNLWNILRGDIDVVLLKEAGFRLIPQGKTDSWGRITVLGAADGDRVIFTSRGEELRGQSVVVSCAAAATATEGSVTEVLLEPAAFDLTASVIPGVDEHLVEVRVKASVTLPDAPALGLAQHATDGLVIVPLAYDNTLQMYTGTMALASERPQSGTLLVYAEDAQGHSVEIAQTFSLTTAPQNEDTIVRSADGQAELYLPAGTLSSSGAVTVEPSQIPLSLPAGQSLLSGPYTTHGSVGVMFDGSATFSLRYLDSGNLSRLDAGSAQIHFWDGSAWIALETTVGQDVQIASATVTSFGTYALLAPELELLHLPLVRR